jgi:enoyl-CoA hydratase
MGNRCRITRVVVAAAPDAFQSAATCVPSTTSDAPAATPGAELLARQYRLNAVIKHYRKPYVALIDGIVMGGGVGISIHGSHRVAGAAWLCDARGWHGFFPMWAPPVPAAAAGELEPTHSPARSSAPATPSRPRGEAVSTRLPDLIDALCTAVPVDALLPAFAPSPAGGPGPVTAHRLAIDRLFKGDRVEDILAALDSEAAAEGRDAEFARAAATAMWKKSPTSLKVALAQLQRGRSLDFDACMRTEFRIVSRMVSGHDLYEGIRAVIVDKDHAPRWQPSALAAVSEADVERYFAPLAEELDLP